MAEISLLYGPLDTASAATRTGPHDATEHAAALAICARARNTADAMLLLDCCGLLRPRPTADPTPEPALVAVAAVDLTPLIDLVAKAVTEAPRPPRRCRGCGYIKTRCACGGGR